MTMTEDRWIAAAVGLGEYLNKTHAGSGNRFSVERHMEWTDGAVYFLLRSETNGFGCTTYGPYSSTDWDAARGFFERCMDSLGLSTTRTLMRMSVMGILK